MTCAWRIQHALFAYIFAETSPAMLTIFNRHIYYYYRDFPRPDSIMSRNFPKWCMAYENIIPNFLVLHFGENFMKIGTKIAKLQMHENADMLSF